MFSATLPLFVSKVHDFWISAFFTLVFNPVFQFSARENELRKLRKVNTEFEEQNAILSKHIENMKKGIDKLEGERKEQQSEINALQRHLAKLRQVISRSFIDIQIPGETDPITLESVDSFVAKLQQYIQENSKENLELTSKIKDIIASLDYPK